MRRKRRSEFVRHVPLKDVQTTSRKEECVSSMVLMLLVHFASMKDVPIRSREEECVSSMVPR
jgi:hypothetical protein